MNAPPAVSTPLYTSRPWWRRKIVVGIVLAAVLIAFHAPLLRAIGGYLIVDEPTERSARVVLFSDTISDPGALDAAAKLYRDGAAAGILACESPPSRAVEVGAWPDETVRLRAELTARGVPAAAIEELPGRSKSTWDAAREIGQWLAGHQDQRLIVLSSLFRGRLERRVLASVLQPQAMAAIHFLALPSTLTADNWWRSRDGLQEVFQEYARWAFLVCHGESTPCAKPWSYDDVLNSLPAAQDQR